MFGTTVIVTPSRRGLCPRPRTQHADPSTPFRTGVAVSVEYWAHEHNARSPARPHRPGPGRAPARRLLLERGRPARLRDQRVRAVLGRDLGLDPVIVGALGVGVGDHPVRERRLAVRVGQPRRAPAVARCTTEDLNHARSRRGRGRVDLLPVRLTNTPRTPCRTGGFGGVSLVDQPPQRARRRAGRPDRGRQREADRPASGRPRATRRCDHRRRRTTRPTKCHPAPRPTGFRVYPPNETHVGVRRATTACRDDRRAPAEPDALPARRMRPRAAGYRRGHDLPPQPADVHRHRDVRRLRPRPARATSATRSTPSTPPTTTCSRRRTAPATWPSAASACSARSEQAVAAAMVIRILATSPTG